MNKISSLRNKFLSCHKKGYNNLKRFRKVNLNNIKYTDKKIPLDALLLGVGVTLPLVIGSLGLNYCCFNGLYME